eukprot:2325065-Prymnesium_polylepis.1
MRAPIGAIGEGEVAQVQQHRDDRKQVELCTERAGHVGRRGVRAKREQEVTWRTREQEVTWRTREQEVTWPTMANVLEPP